MTATLQTRYRVDGMDCAGCATKIDAAVRRMPGVGDVAVSVTAGTMTVRHCETSDLGAIEKKVTGLGYQVTPLKDGSLAPDNSTAQRDQVDEASHKSEGVHGHDHGPTTGAWWQSKKGRLTLACGGALMAAFAIGKLAPSISAYAYLAAMLIGLVPIARRAFAAAIAGTPFSIELLMTLAAVGAVLINATEEAATVVFLFLVGELLEGVAAGKARASIQSLTALVPKTAQLEAEDIEERAGLGRVAAYLKGDSSHQHARIVREWCFVQLDL